MWISFIMTYGSYKIHLIWRIISKILDRENYTFNSYKLTYPYKHKLSTYLQTLILLCDIYSVHVLHQELILEFISFKVTVPRMPHSAPASFLELALPYSYVSCVLSLHTATSLFTGSVINYHFLHVAWQIINNQAVCFVL